MKQVEQQFHIVIRITECRLIVLRRLKQDEFILCFEFVNLATQQAVTANFIDVVQAKLGDTNDQP